MLPTTFANIAFGLLQRVLICGVVLPVFTVANACLSQESTPPRDPAVELVLKDSEGVRAQEAWRELASRDELDETSVALLLPRLSDTPDDTLFFAGRAIGRADKKGAAQALRVLDAKVYSKSSTDLKTAAVLFAGAALQDDRSSELLDRATRWADDARVPEINRARSRALLWCLGRRTESTQRGLRADLVIRPDLVDSGLGDSVPFRTLDMVLLLDAMDELDDDMIKGVIGAFGTKDDYLATEYNLERQCLILAALYRAGGRAKAAHAILEPLTTTKNSRISLRLLSQLTLRQISGEKPEPLARDQRLLGSLRDFGARRQWADVGAVFYAAPYFADSSLVCELVEQMKNAGDDQDLFDGCWIFLGSLATSRDSMTQLIEMLPTLPNDRQARVARLIAGLALSRDEPLLEKATKSKWDPKVGGELQTALENSRTFRAR